MFLRKNFFIRGVFFVLLSAGIFFSIAFAYEYPQPPDFHLSPQTALLSDITAGESAEGASFSVSVHPREGSELGWRYDLFLETEWYPGGECTVWDEEADACAEYVFAPVTDLCPYVRLRQQGQETPPESFGGGVLDSTETGAPASHAWRAIVTIPCAEGMCPPGTDERDPEMAFPRGLLNRELSCDVVVKPHEYFLLTQNLPSVAYAQTTEVPLTHFRITAKVVAPTPTCTEHCFSNIAFLPGFQASRLYTEGILLEDRLWEPNSASDLRTIALKTDGSSVRSDIYTRDIMDDFLGVFSTYEEFTKMLKKMKSEETIKDFRLLPYDWRFDPRDVVAQGVQYENEVRRMETEIEELAETSKTGKVTIIAHSMGGHVAKVLVDTLKERGEADLIDRIIFVATPHLGTPKAIAGLLHGDGQEIPSEEESRRFVGKLVSPKEARTMGEHMQSAYNLLPSAGYFARVFDPVIDLANARTLQSDAMPTYLIREEETFKAFLSGTGNPSRMDPEESDVDTPNVLDADKLLRARVFHMIYDLWTPPYGIETVNIIGWGIPTYTGLRYEERLHSCLPNTSCTPTHYKRDPIFTVEGDKTVVWASADEGEGRKFFVDLMSYNKQNQAKTQHSNIMEIIPIQQLIKNIITENSSLPEFISTTKPELSAASSTLRLSIYSPADLHLYDSSGRHTGRLPSNDGFIHYEEGIPGTTYMELGESKHIIAPEGDYRSELQGTGEGTFDFIIRSSNGGNTEETPRATYIDVPVSTETIATVAISLDTPPAPLSLDTDGDGTEDESVLPEEASVQTFPELLALFRIKVDTLATSPATKNNLLLRASSTEATYQKLLTLREARKDRRTALSALFDVRLSSSFSSFLAYTNTLATLPPERKRKLTSVQEATLNALLKEIEASLAPDEESGLPPEIETVHALIENAKIQIQTLSLHPSTLAQITKKLTAIETRHARALTRLGTFDARTKLAEANLKKVLTTKLTNLSLYTNRLSALPAKNKNRLTTEDATALQSIISNLTNLIETI